jgi:hypothetical protein
MPAGKPLHGATTTTGIIRIVPSADLAPEEFAKKATKTTKIAVIFWSPRGQTHGGHKSGLHVSP